MNDPGGAGEAARDVPAAAGLSEFGGDDEGRPLDAVIIATWPPSHCALTCSVPYADTAHRPADQSLSVLFTVRLLQRRRVRPGITLQDDVPLANLIAMIDEARQR